MRRLQISTIKRILLLLLSYFLIAFGVEVVLVTKIGCSAIDSFNYYLGSLIGINMGISSMITGTIITLILFIIKKDKKLLVSFSGIFGIGLIFYLIDYLVGFIPISFSLEVWSWTYLVRVLLAFIGINIVCLGTTCTFKSRLSGSPIDVLSKEFGKLCHSIQLGKWTADFLFIICALCICMFNTYILKIESVGFSLKQLGFEELTLYTVLQTFLYGPVLGVYVRLLIGKDFIKKERILEKKEVKTMKLNKYIDSTKLGFLVTKEDIDKLIADAINYQFMSVCVNPIYVKYAKEKLKGSGVLVCTVIGFPHGTHLPAVKAYEAKQAVECGADELDMVINVKALKEKDDEMILDEIQRVVHEAGGRCVKVILETCLLTPEEIVRGTLIAMQSKATYVKTSTGFSSSGASVEAVKLMLDTAGGNILVKASGGIRSYEDAIKFINLGASRIGTSNGVAIMNGPTGGNANDSNTTY